MKKGDNFYKVCSRYLGFLTKRIDVWLKAEGYRLISTSTTDIKTATYYYRKDSLEAYIKQILALKDDDLKKLEVKYSVIVVKVNNKKELIELEALIKSLKIPNSMIIAGINYS